ncbi:MAG: DUF1893 domain-containing protein [Oscillospiraceae bacterium]|nr:DUF1893 domain-containing protein [Oscillospiraceae bacterium]
MDWECAKKALQQGCTCAAYRDSESIQTDERGVAPLLRWLDEGVDLMGFSVADKAVGSAAAMLYCLLGVRRVYGRVMSVGAVKILRSQGIEVGWEFLTESILNRRKNGLCPMETALLGIEDPDEGLAIIRRTLENLQNAR